MPTEFPPDVVAAVCRHMTDDHADEALLICRALGQAPDAVTAQAVDVDGAGMRFRVRDGAGDERSVTVPFGAPVTERAQIRAAVVELHERARAAAGVAPGPDR